MKLFVIICLIMAKMLKTVLIDDACCGHFGEIERWSKKSGIHLHAFVYFD